MTPKDKSIELVNKYLQIYDGRVQQAKQRAKNYMSLKGALEPKQIKCYCGHTTYCDCGPLEEPKQETHICKWCKAETWQSDDECYAKPETLEEVELAILFHNTYERLAPSFGYETRLDTKYFETNTPNGMLMIAVCKEIIKWQQERSYSEEDMRKAFIAGGNSQIEEDDDYGTEYDAYMEEWFEQFKKK
jgi:hypothetical protein